MGVTLDWKDGCDMDEPISRKAVEKCLKEQKNGKAAEPNEIP